MRVSFVDSCVIFGLHVRFAELEYVMNTRYTLCSSTLISIHICYYFLVFGVRSSCVIDEYMYFVSPSDGIHWLYRISILDSYVGPLWYIWSKLMIQGLPVTDCIQIYIAIRPVCNPSVDRPRKVNQISSDTFSTQTLTRARNRPRQCIHVHMGFKLHSCMVYFSKLVLLFQFLSVCLYCNVLIKYISVWCCLWISMCMDVREFLNCVQGVCEFLFSYVPKFNVGSGRIAAWRRWNKPQICVSVRVVCCCMKEVK